LSAPFLGSLSDKIGRKPVLIISIFSTAIGWLVFATAHSLLFLFIGRIIDGLAAGNISTAQSALVDVAKDEKERTANLGIVGMMFGIGFVIGPLLGGVLSHFNPTLPFWIVGAMSFINAILAVFFFPETNHNRNTAKLKLNPFTPIVRALKNTKLLPSFSTWLLFGLATTGFYAIFAFYLQKLFNFDQVFVGICLGVMGVIMAFNQAVAIKKFWLKRFKEPQLEIIMVIALGLAFLLMSTGILPIFFIGFIIMTFANGILQVVITSQTIGSADPKTKGEVTGMLFAISSVAAIIAPLISGNLFDFKPFIAVLISAIYMVIALVIIIVNRKKLTQVSSAEEEVVPPVI
jgi:DHA1 family tetracycline resistance protein-like MFS transporter